MNRSFIAMAFAVGVLGLTGCTSSTRDAMQKEYERLAALEPTTAALQCGDQRIDQMGTTSFSSKNFSLKLMKEYVAATTNHREYLAFMGDVDYFVKEQKMEESAAMDQATKEIKAADEKRPDNEKVWPRVEAGYQATQALNPTQKLTEIAPVSLQVANTSAQASELKQSFKGLDAATLRKAKVCADIISECTTTTECLAFLTLQFQRTLKAKMYMK